MKNIFETLERAKKCTKLNMGYKKQSILIENLGKCSSTDLDGEYYRFEILYREVRE